MMPPLPLDQAVIPSLHLSGFLLPVFVLLFYNYRSYLIWEGYKNNG